MIHAEFKDLDEMMAFAKTLAGMQTEKAAPADPSAQSQLPVMAPPVQGQLPVTMPPVQGRLPVTTPAIQGQPPVTAPAPSAGVPTSTHTYVLDDLARAAGTLMDAGRQAELIGLLKQFGVNSLPELPQAQYGAFATALRGLGAQI